MARIPLGRVANNELPGLTRVARQFPNRDSAVAEIARLQAECHLPVGSIHVISDIHGEDAKLRHVLHNGSGTLRPLIEELFASELSPEELRRLVALFFTRMKCLLLKRSALEQRKNSIPFELALSRLVRLVRVISKIVALRASMRSPTPPSAIFFWNWPADHPPKPNPNSTKP